MLVSFTQVVPILYHGTAFDAFDNFRDSARRRHRPSTLQVQRSGSPHWRAHCLIRAATDRAWARKIINVGR
jgi:hypothetical protein